MNSSDIEKILESPVGDDCVDLVQHLMRTRPTRLTFQDLDTDVNPWTMKEFAIIFDALWRSSKQQYAQLFMADLSKFISVSIFVFFLLKCPNKIWEIHY